MIWPGPTHIPYTVKEPEVFYRAPESLMETVLARHAERLAHPHSVMNRIVFDYIDPNPLAKTADLPPLPPGQLRPYYVPESDADRTLVFESRFECGNLRRAIQVYAFVGRGMETPKRKGNREMDGRARVVITGMFG